MTNATAEIAVEAASIFPVMIGSVPDETVTQRLSMTMRTCRTGGLKRLQVDVQRAEERLKLRALQFHQQASVQALCETSASTQSILSLFR